MHFAAPSLHQMGESAVGIWQTSSGRQIPERSSPVCCTKSSPEVLLCRIEPLHCCTAAMLHWRTAHKTVCNCGRQLGPSVCLLASARRCLLASVCWPSKMHRPQSQPPRNGPPAAPARFRRTGGRPESERNLASRESGGASPLDSAALVARFACVARRGLADEPPDSSA